MEEDGTRENRSSWEASAGGSCVRILGVAFGGEEDMFIVKARLANRCSPSMPGLVSYTYKEEPIVEGSF